MRSRRTAPVREELRTPGRARDVVAGGLVAATVALHVVGATVPEEPRPPRGR